MTNRIIVIGSGIAGFSALKAIRDVDKDSEIFLLGEEKYYPYYRLKLSKNLFDQLSEDNSLIQKKDWYNENNIKLWLDNRITNVDIEKKSVALSDGSVLKYDKLLFANGAENFKPPVDGIDKAGVFSLRTLENAFSIRNQIGRQDEVIVIGGGIQGLETVWSLFQYGAKVSVVELLPRIMPNQLDERASEILRQAVESFGIKMHLSTNVSKIFGEAEVEGIITNTGELLPCNKIIYSVGIRPNIGIVRDTSVKYRKGIIVNEKMETNVDGVYAAGDIAEFCNNVAGSWNASMSQGRTAGYNIAGKADIYRPVVPVIYLNAFKLSLVSMGSMDAAKADHILTEEGNDGRYFKILISSGKIAGAIVIGDSKRSLQLKTALEKGTELGISDFFGITVGQLLDKL